MLTHVEVRTERGELLVLPLQDVSNGFIVEDIEGLDPVKAVIVSSSFAQLDGEQQQSARREKRNIIIKLALEPDYSVGSVQGLRNTLFRHFMPKSWVSLRFILTGHPTVDIRGQVETFVAPKFVKEPTATISILCFDPDFYTPSTVDFDGDTTASMEPGVGTVTHMYEGTVDSGFLFTLYPDRSLESFNMLIRPVSLDLPTNLLFIPLSSLLAGDVLRISTVAGNKFAKLTRDAIESSILHGVAPTSAWPTLGPGNNLIRIFAEGDPIPYSIEYTTKFGAL